METKDGCKSLLWLRGRGEGRLGIECAAKKLTTFCFSRELLSDCPSSR